MGLLLLVVGLVSCQAKSSPPNNPLDPSPETPPAEASCRWEFASEFNFVPPAVLPVFQVQPLSIGASETSQWIQNLEEKEWGTMEEAQEGEGSLILRQRGLAPSPVPMRPEERMEAAKAFLEDSGMEAFLEDQGFLYQMDCDEVAVICHILESGDRTGAFVRMIFEGRKAPSECSMVLFQSTPIERLPTLSIETAMKSAFTSSENQEANPSDYLIQRVTIQYAKGVPYYRVHATGKTLRSLITWYALAVDLEHSQAKEQILEAVQTFRSSL